MIEGKCLEGDGDILVFWCPFFGVLLEIIFLVVLLTQALSLYF